MAGSRCTLPNANNSLKTAVFGVSGYSGAELVRLLLAHPKLQGTPPLLLGRDNRVLALEALHPRLTGVPGSAGLTVVPFNYELLLREAIDILFLALPHEQSREIAPLAVAQGIRVVDLSGAWRLHDPNNASVYHFADVDPVAAQSLQSVAVYGSPELHGPAIVKAKLVANPGCYATSCILALAPLLRANLVDLHHGIICDAKSGVSGAGRTPTPITHFMHGADNLSTYAVFGHRHTGELLEQLELTAAQIQFTPHLLPIPRGILSTVYARLDRPGTVDAIQECYGSFYSSSPMVRVRQSPMLPEIQHVTHTNFCDIGFQLAPDHQRLVIVSCLDNLLKGAASQAVQNMNLMAGWHEAEGLV